MDKKALDSLVVKKDRLGKNEVVGIRVPTKTLDRLKQKGIDVQSTVRNVLERLAE